MLSKKLERLEEMINFNSELAIEVYCELYIYNNYSKEALGVDTQSYFEPERKTEPSWLENLQYRLNQILKFSGIQFELNTEEVEEMATNPGKFVASPI